MTPFQKFNCFVEDLAEKYHNLGSDSLTIELVAVANAPTAASTTITPIAYTNLPTSRVLAGVAGSQVAGVYTLTANDLVLTATGNVATFRYAVLVNASAAAGHQLIGFWEYPSDVSLTIGKKFTIDLVSYILSLS